MFKFKDKCEPRYKVVPSLDGAGSCVWAIEKRVYSLAGAVYVPVSAAKYERKCDAIKAVEHLMSESTRC